MRHASIVVELGQIRCDSCQVAMHDELATVCPICGAVFDSIVSNQPGLTAMLKRRREAAGIHPCQTRLAPQETGRLERTGSHRRLRNESAAKYHHSDTCS